jgi:hypothetical protein
VLVVREGTIEGEILADEGARVEEEAGDIGKETSVGETEAPGAKSAAPSKGSSLGVESSAADRPLEGSLDVVGPTHGPVVVEGEGTEECTNKCVANDIFVLEFEVVCEVGTEPGSLTWTSTLGGGEEGC